jgi:1-deoxy-D-xylulose-5-phosphate reductoisomerase
MSGGIRMQTISILGSTGSIGTQALQLVALHPERFRVAAMTAHSNRALFFEQVRRFRPEMAGLTQPIPMDEIPVTLQSPRPTASLSPTEEDPGDESVILLNQL